MDGGTDGFGDDDGHPGIPTGLTAGAENKAVRLTWNPNPETDIFGYRIWLGLSEDTLEEFALVEAPDTELTVGDLDNWTEYFFSIQAENRCGGISEPSSPVSATPQPDLVAPVDFIGIPGDGRIDFYWTHIQDAGVVAYTIHWGTAEDELTHSVPIQVRAVDSYTLSGLDNDVSVFYAMEVEYLSGEHSLLTHVGRARPFGADTTGPQVTEVTPADGQSGTELTSLIAVRFDEPMNPETIEVSLDPAHDLGDGHYSQDFDLVVFGPALPLPEGTSYTLSVAGKDMSGNDLTGQTVFSFATVAEALFTEPVANGMSPPDGAVGVSPDTRIVIGFSEAMNPDSVEGHFNTNPDVDCAFDWNEALTAMTCTPTNSLPENTHYEVNVIEGVVDKQGHPMSSGFSSAFQTGPFNPAADYPPRVMAHLPGNGDIGVARKPEISVAFSEPMDRAWAQAAFRIDSPHDVPGTFRWNPQGNIMTFTATENLGYGTEATWRVLAGARDLAGNPMEADVSGGFRVIRLERTYLLSQPGLDGTITSFGEVYLDLTYLRVGIWHNADGVRASYRSYLSYDMSPLPEDLLRIKNVTYFNFLLDIAGSPWPSLGYLKLTRVQYGDTLDASDFELMAVPYEICENDECDMYIGLLYYNSPRGRVESDLTWAFRADWDNRVAQGYRAQYQYHFGQDDFDEADPPEEAKVVFLSGEAYQGQGTALKVEYEIP